MFNRGNAFMWLSNFPAAIESYDLALEERPGWQAALENLTLAKARLARITSSADEEEEPQRERSTRNTRWAAT